MIKKEYRVLVTYKDIRYNYPYFEPFNSLKEAEDYCEKRIKEEDIYSVSIDIRYLKEKEL